MGSDITNFVKKMNNCLLNIKVAEAIEKNPRIILILERLSIPLGVKEHTFSSICKAYNINEKLLICLINISDNISPQILDGLSFNDIRKIIDYLSMTHNYFQNEMFPIIDRGILELLKNNPPKEIQLLSQFYKDYCNEVIEHFKYENEVAFPYILSLINNLESPQDNSIQTTIKYCVNDYKSHHDNIEEKLNDMMSLLIKFIPPQINYRVRRNMIFHLNELKRDLNNHSIIENNLLIPIVSKIEEN